MLNKAILELSFLKNKKRVIFGGSHAGKLLSVIYKYNNLCLAEKERRRVPNIHLLLIVLHYCGEIWGRTRFQKIVFLLKERFGIKSSYRFIPYNYGPYSKDLQFDIDLLHLVDAIRVELKDGTPYMHSLTQKGVELAQKAEQEMDAGELQRLADAVENMRYRSTDSLIEEAKSIVNLAIR